MLSQLPVYYRLLYSFLLSYGLTLLSGPKWIQWLKKHKIGQIIKKEGPVNHIIKQGTPSMGGLFLIGSLLITVFTFTFWLTAEIIILVTSLLLFSSIGFLDDFLKVKKQTGEGLNFIQKMSLQSFAAWGIIYSIYLLKGSSITELSIPFSVGLSVEMGIFYYIFSWIYLVGFVNSVNLTDGLDGLAAGLSSFTAFAVIIISFFSVSSHVSGYGSVKGSEEVGIFYTALLGSLTAFMIFNRHPAKVFMGDTGSEALGGLFGVTAILLNAEILLLLISGVFIIESISVILQVGYYKMKHKRIFLMAPLHHHYELKGWKEGAIVLRFWLVGGILTGLGTIAVFV
ncbi:MAG: phospho-N-acetylmuramoyl-pentapeptide-transferase [Spirochaetia bacterium]|nr:phospho-N-acetylmuramoyl-pentapeptide-transferase [Spirochaetia bacterium]MCF7946450.1 phospho-N-acetylmuramoyl-pentapeptide-transferase [Spirochaetia bacterium]